MAAVPLTHAIAYSCARWLTGVDFERRFAGLVEHMHFFLLVKIHSMTDNDDCTR